MLDTFNSRAYRARPILKVAQLHWDAAEYQLERGTERFEGPHMRVLDPRAPYGVDLTIFFATHRAVAECRDHYVKVVDVRAALVTAPFTLVTLVQGSIEMVAEVAVGDIVVQNPDGEVYAMPVNQFDLRYELVD